MSTKAVSPDMVQPSTDDERWATWVARGVAQDQKTKKYGLAVTVTVAVVLAVRLAFALAAL
jgi:hypothetical protein